MHPLNELGTRSRVESSQVVSSRINVKLLLQIKLDKLIANHEPLSIFMEGKVDSKWHTAKTVQF